MLITFFVILVLYIIVLILLQVDSVSETQLFGDRLTVLLNVLKDFFLVIISIIGTTLLTSTIIEKNQKNTTYTELLANDIFASPEFYSNLSDENKQKMIENLERNFYDRQSIKQELYDVFRQNLNEIQQDYYYEECNFNISYFPQKSYSEKVIVRTIKMRAYSDTITIPNLKLCGYSLSPVNVENSVKNKDLSPFEFISLNINNKAHSADDIIISEDATMDQLLNKCGYVVSYTVNLKENITLSASEDTIIRMEYRSRVSDNDNSMSFRVAVPCRKYILNFIAPENYKVIAHAFGSFDVAANSSNSKYDNTISVEFDNWLLPENGVTICCINKDLSAESDTSKTLVGV